MKSMFINLFNYIYDFLINIIMHIYNFICAIITTIINELTLISSKDLSLELLAGEMSLLALYFVFLPIIVDRNSKEYYLGYNMYKWILYDKRKLKKLPDISWNWIISIFLILSGIFFYGHSNYTGVTIIFFIFIALISFKVIEYLILSSNDKKTHKEIEKQFLKDCIKDNKKVSDLLINNIDNNNVVLRKNIKFILKNYDNNGVSDTFNNLYLTITQNNDELQYVILLEEIMIKIKETKIDFQFNVDPWDLYYYIKNNLKDNNEKSVYPIIQLIMSNSVKLGLKNEKYYSEILPILFKAVNENKEISDSLKNEMSEMLIKEISYLRFKEEKNADAILPRYKYITNFTKFILDGNYDKYLDDLFENFDDYSFNEEHFDVIISLLTYMYYVIKVEIEEYVNDEKKQKYLLLYSRLVRFINNNEHLMWEDDYVKNLFIKMKHISRSWEIYKDGQVKTPLADRSVEIANKSLLVYSRIHNYKHNKSINSYDLDLFKYNFENGAIKNDVYKSIKDYLDFLRLNVKDDDINKYFETLLNIARKEYKFRNQVSEEDIKNGADKIPVLKKDLIERLNKYTIFNNIDASNIVEIPIRRSFDNSTINYLVDNINFYNNEFLYRVIGYLYSNISKEITDKIEYSYNNYNPILKKMNNLKSNYYYICNEEDNLGEKWNLGEKYSKAKNRFKVATMPLHDGAMLVKNYACSLLDVEMEITELKESEIQLYLKRYKNGRKYVVNEFGYDVPYTKREITKYIKLNHFTISIMAKIKLEVVNNKGTVFVCVNKNKKTKAKRGKK